MDSGNSGSIQSSSGGDDDVYDSRAAADSSSSSFINNPIFNPNSFSSHSQQPSPIFTDNYNFHPPVSSNPSSRPQNPNSNLLNLDMLWSKSQHNNINPSDQINNSFFTPSFPHHQISESTPTADPPPRVGGGGVGGGGIVSTAASSSSSMANNANPTDQSQTHVARNPKKRSRASRRAPTTVLTTDTSNFRAMVQEFTGIPAPPFTSSSPFPRTRLDLFGTPSIRSQPPQPYSHHHLLRPFAQKGQPPLPFISSSSSSPSSLLNIDSNVISPQLVSRNTNNNINTSSPSELGLLKQPGNNSSTNQLQIQNPILSFQSFLQPSSPKFPSNDSHLKMGVLDDHQFNLSHAQINNTAPANMISGLPSLVSQRNDNGDGNHGGGGDGGYGRLNNYSGSSSNFQGSSKGLTTENNVTASVSSTRGENLMESWICSSD